MRIVILLVLLPFSSIAQDLKFGFANNSGQFLNPASTGLSANGRLTLLHRNEWPSLSGGIQSTLISYEHVTGSALQNFGVYMVSDRMARNTIITNDLGFSWNYPMRVTRELTLSIGLSAVLKHTFIDVGKLTWGDVINSRTGAIFTNQINKTHDFGMDNHLGLMLFTKNLYFGFSARHLLSINYGEPTSYNIQGGYTFRIKDKNDYKHFWTGNAGIAYTFQNNNHRMEVNASVQYNRFILGGSIGNVRAYGVLAGVEFGSVKLAYQYDLNRNMWTLSTAGSHEFMLSYKFVKRKRVKCGIGQRFVDHSDF